MKHVTVQVFPDKKIGIWQGMGGAITEATAYNFKKLINELSDIIDKIPFPKNVKELFQIKTLQRINKEIESKNINNQKKDDK